MGARQKRYRETKLTSGWERVELLVPAAAVPWLKAYARALRDAVALDLPPPRFDGMGAVAETSASRTPRSTRPSPPPQPRPGLAVPEAAPARAEPTAPPPAAPVVRPTDSPGSAPEAFFDRVADKRRREAEEAIRRPDFSRGLLSDE